MSKTSFRRRIPTLVFLPVLGACGNVTSGGAPSDAGAPAADAASSPTDAGPGDANVDAATPSDAAPEAGAAGPTRIVSGASLHVHGVTSDGFVVYDDGATLSAVGVAGGTPKAITAFTGKLHTSVRGKVLFIWTNVDATNHGSLALWTSAAGYHPGVATGATIDSAFERVVAASDDGARVLFQANHSTSANTTDWVGASADGTNAQTLYAGNTCVGHVGFAGPYAIWQACDTSMTQFSLSWYDAAWTLKGAKSGFYDFSVDTAGSQIFLVGPSSGELDALDGSSSTPVPVQAFRAVLAADASSVFWIDSAEPGTLSATTLPGLQTTALVTGIPEPLAFSGGEFVASPDRRWIGISSMILGDAGNIDHIELRVASTTAPSTPSGVTIQEGSVAFTRDGSHAFYRRAGASTASLYALAGATGTESHIADAVYFDVQAAHDATAVFTANYVAGTAGAPGHGDLSVVDTSKNGPPTLLAAGAFVPTAQTADGRTAVFATNATVGAEGIYTVPIP